MTDGVYEFPATPTQASLWSIHQMDPAGTAYHIPASFELTGSIDADALLRAVAALADRHEILRTIFVSRGDELLQRILPRIEVDWAHDHAPASASRSHLVTLARRLTQQTFDLEIGPLFRVRLSSFGEERHLLTFVFHHIVMDHISLGRFSTELTDLYAAEKNARQPRLSEPEIQFADYTIWLLETVLPVQVSEGLPVWTKALADFSGTLDLPTDHPHASSTGKGAEAQFSFTRPLSGQVSAFAKAEGLSLFNVMLGALQTLLFHYCGQDDIVVGTPFANRGDDDRLEAVLGCFMNTLPIGVRMDPTWDFRSVLSASRAALFSAHEHQAVPFESIVNELAPRRELGLNPLYQFGFVFQEPPVVIRLEGLEVTDLEIHSGGAMYDLHMWMWEQDGLIEGKVWYDMSLFGPEKVDRFTQRLSALTERLVGSPDQPIGAISITTERDAAWEDEQNRTTVAWKGPETVLELIAEQASRTPDATAVIADSVAVSYAELIERARKVATTLASAGVGEHDLVGIHMARNAGLIPTLLGTQMVGAAYVPLDPDYPAGRLGFIAQASGLSALVTDGSQIDFDVPGACTLVTPMTVSGTAARPEGAAGPNSAMYVIFTSGSTGQPKGVVVPHRCVVNLLRSMADLPGLGDGARLLAVTTLSFDISVLELFLPLVTGGTVVLADADQALDGRAMSELMLRHDVSAMQATPSTWRLLLDSGWGGSPKMTALCGGEALPPDLARDLSHKVGRLWNVYGPTETTIWSTRDEVSSGPVTIGRPIANTACHVLGPQGTRLPMDVVGELCIGGAGVTDGYLGRPDLTEARFIENPFGPGRLYRTGDLARWLPDGRLQYLGRTDDQVKVNGYRIELGEVEAALNSHPLVRQAVAAVQRGDHGDARLFAFVVPDDGAQIIASELRRHARQTLPDYMVPGVVMEIDSLPLTPNGKIDRRNLLAKSIGLFGQRTRIPPETDAEKVVAAVWSQALGIESLSREDNFFELGGHSLLAIRVAHELRTKLNSEIDPRSLFFSSLAQLAGTAN